MQQFHKLQRRIELDILDVDNKWCPIIVFQLKLDVIFYCFLSKIHIFVFMRLGPLSVTLPIIEKFYLISALGTLLQVAGKLSVHFCSLVPDYLLHTATVEGRSCWVTKHLDFLRLTQVSRDKCVVNITVAYQQWSSVSSANDE